MIASILSLIGGGIGGILRLIPEALRLLDARNERDHEFRMTEAQLKIDAARAAQQIDQTHAAGVENEIAANQGVLLEAVRGQNELTGDTFIDRLSRTVRPIVTYWWMVLYSFYKAVLAVWAWQTTDTLKGFADIIWTADDWGILSMILMFWFVGRTIARREGR